MAEPSHRAQQCAIHMAFGFIPVLKVRQSVPSSNYSWEWGPWRMARIGELVAINALLMRTWRE